MIRYVEEHLRTPIADEVDVLVVGGGASGTVAAMAAARSGARTLILERTGCLGGTATVNLIAQWVAFFHGDTRVVGGIPYELTQKVIALGGSEGFHRYVMGEAAGTPFGLKTLPLNPEVVKIALDEAAAKAGVEVLFHTTFSRTLTLGETATGAVVETVAGRRAYFAKAVIDATGDAAVAASAGAGFLSDSNDARRERQPCTLSFRLSNVDVPAFRALPSAERRRLVLGGLQRGELFWQSLSFVSTPGETDAVCLMSRILGIDALSEKDASRAEQEGRRQIDSIVRFLKREIPGFKNCVLADIAERVGVRETRRIEGLHVFSEQDIMQERDFEDSIALGAGPMDRHDEKGTGITLYAPPSPFEIPLRALLPKKVRSLVVPGRAFSATREAMAGARHMATCMAMGEAAGALAAVAARSGRLPSEVPAKEVQQRLLATGALFKREHVRTRQATEAST